MLANVRTTRHSRRRTCRQSRQGTLQSLVPVPSGRSDGLRPPKSGPTASWVRPLGARRRLTAAVRAFVCVAFLFVALDGALLPVAAAASNESTARFSAHVEPEAPAPGRPNSTLVALTPVAQNDAAAGSSEEGSASTGQAASGSSTAKQLRGQAGSPPSGSTDASAPNERRQGTEQPSKQTQEQTPARQTAESKGPAGSKSSQQAAPARPVRQRRRPPSHPPWELWPYRVRLAVGFQPEVLRATGLRRQVLHELRVGLERTYGQMWQSRLTPLDWLVPQVRESLARVTPDTVKQHLPSDDRQWPDKVFLVVVEAKGGRFTVSGREWDRSTETLTPVVSSDLFAPQFVGAAVLRLVTQLFRPVAEIEQSETETVLVKLRAGEFLPFDSPDAAVQPGTFFVPFYRYLDRDYRVRAIQFVPWTYLRFVSRERARATCQLVSALRLPLGTGRRRRVEAQAIAVRPYFDQTELTLVSQLNPAKRLVGYRVLIFNKKPQRRTQPADGQKEQKPAEPVEKPLIVLSDRDGTVAVPVDRQHPLRWVYVQSGKNLLARVPLVPGVQQKMTIPVPDDSILLQVQAELADLEARLIDLVAQRTVLLALIQKFADDEKWQQVDQAVARLKQLPPRRTLETELRAIQFAAVRKAQQAGLRGLERKIQKECGELADVMKRYLDDSKVRDVLSEVEQLRQVSGKNR